MANCLLDLLGCIRAFILGSLRMILFFGCLIMFLIHLAAIILSYNNNTNVDDLPNNEAKAGDYVHAYAALAAYLLGCYASFYKHKTALKIFVVILFFTTLVTFMQLLNIAGSDQVEKRVGDTFDAMSNLMPSYDWTSLGSNNKANRAWDKMQKFMCCGIKGPKDWDKYRPSSMKRDRLPGSCCLPMHGTRCTIEESFGTGCRERWEQVQMFAVLVYIVYIIVHSLLLVIGLATLSPDNGCCSRSQATEDGHHHQQHRQQQVPGPFQKLDQSVYVRQPAYNPIAGDTKGPVISYPDLSQKAGYQPPPSYGSRA